MTGDQIDYREDDRLMIHEAEAIDSLRHRGFAVIVWTPSELSSANGRRVEDRLIELGWDVIDALKEDEQ